MASIFQKMMFVLILLPSVVSAQETGIIFDRFSDWQKLKNRAKTENKYIFIDCYATWCAPCKEMDNEVYNRDDVGKFYNNHFISVRVQMDSTQKDDMEIKHLYGFARQLQVDFRVTNLPCFLFFSPDGEIVHKGVGGVTPKGFIQLGTNAITTDMQYFTLMEKYKSANLPIGEYPKLAKMEMTLGDKTIAMEIAKKYNDKYLDKLDDKDFITKQNLDFVAQYPKVLSSKSKGFHLAYEQPKKIDSVLNFPGYASNWVISVIKTELVNPIVDKANLLHSVPKWGIIRKDITDNFNSKYADILVLNAKISWSYDKKDWNSYVSYLIERMETNHDNHTGFNGVVYWNNYAWEIFQHTNKKKFLNKALQAADRGILLLDKPDVTIMDTKANVLYRLGNKQVAIKLEEKVAKIDSAFRKQLNLMKSGKPTWNIVE